MSWILVAAKSQILHTHTPRFVCHSNLHITVYKQKLCIETKVLNMQVWKSGGDVAEYMGQAALVIT